MLNAIFLCAIILVYGAILIGLISFFIPDKEIRKTIKEYVIAAFIIGICLFGLSFLGVNYLKSASYIDSKKTNDIEILSLADNSENSGKVSKFYLSVEPNDVYSYYYQTESGAYKRGKVKADSSNIYEEDNCIPHIVEYTYYEKSKANSIIYGFLTFSSAEKNWKTYEIHIPKGTICKKYNLDSQ